MSESPQVDAATLERLQRLGGNEFVCKMIDLFLDYAAKKIAEARAAQEAGNLTGVENAVHPIKSSAGNVGALRLRELASRLEDLAHRGEADAVAVSLTELELAFGAVIPELEQRRRARPAGTA